MQTALRDLTTPRERPSYRLDGGRVLQMRSPYDLSIEEYESLEALFIAYGAVLDTPARRRTKPDIAERVRLTRAIVSVAFGADDAYKALGDMRATLAVSDFLDLCAPIVRSLQANRAADPETPSPSVNSSRSSRGSTAAPRGRGSRKRRSAR